MVTFSNDSDILKYEPVLFGELHLPNQILAAGTGAVLEGTTFTAQDADFIAAQVSEGGVVYLRSADGLLDGTYEIVSVDSATQLSVSVIRADAANDAIAPPAAVNVSYRICTYAPQAGRVGFNLTKYFAIRPGNPAGLYGLENIFDKTVLKDASVFGVISLVYATLAGGAKAENLREKCLYYRRLFEKERQMCLLGIDFDLDGKAEFGIFGSAFNLLRD